jgi:hypothetical protein
MKPLKAIQATGARRMNPSPSPFRALAAVPALVMLASATAAQGQSVGSLQSTAPAAAQPAPAGQKPKTPATPSASKAAPEKAAVNNPSRYIGENDLAAYVNSVSAALAIRSRATDPFGQYQDPDARPVIRTPIAKTTRRVAPVQTFPFSEIINRIKVNTVMPAEKKFLIGTRTFNQGERMNLTFRMKNIPVEIVSVSAGEIGFRNAETGENATLKMHLLPAGMTPGTGRIEAPGMVRERKGDPIDLDSATSSEDAQNNS